MASKSFVFCFDDVEVRERELSLVKADQALTVEPKAFRVLLFLLRNPQRLVSKEEILNAVWGDVAVGEGSLTRCIWMLRNALGDDNRSPRYIETVATVGYRFIGKVEVSEDAPGEPEAAGKPNGVSGVETKVGSRKAVWGWVLTGCVVLALCGTGAIWYLRRPLPPPHITEYTKITHDGRPKYLVGTDGNRLYFNQGPPMHSTSMAQVGVTGGETAQIPVTVPHFDRLVDVSPDGSSFLINSAVDGVGDGLWSVRMLGGSLRRLSDASLDAAFSPDGNSVAYSTYEGDIYFVRSDGTGAHKLASPGGSPFFLTWSPDGSTIRFRGNNNGICNGICEMSSNGSNRHPVLPAWHNSDQWDGRWSPDGKFFFLGSGGQIWAIDEQRGPLRHTPTEPIQLTSGPINWATPVVSKDGKKIFAVGLNPRGELSRFDSQSKQLSAFLGGISAESVSFSQDGRFVTYVSFPEGILWKANRDGSSPVQLTDPPIYPAGPQWSPDGTRIVFTDLSNRYSHIVSYIVSSTGGGLRRLLPADNGQQFDPSWSADGKKIIFNHDDAPYVSVVDIASGQITTLPGSEGIANPRASPNGRFIAGLVPGPPFGIRIFDFETQRWSAVLVTNMPTLFHTWSRDSRFIYFFHNGPDQGVFRIRSTGGQPERVADLKDMHHAGSMGFWFGLDPTDAPLLLRDVGSADIYALTLEEK
jgi:Tol biopolymer transport system component/DNA-binding winged helix-turn-helix (wHTH) protein